MTKRTRAVHPIILGVFILVSTIVLIPISVVTTLSISCSVKTNNLKDQTKEIQERLAVIKKATPGLSATATTNGDCLTGSGTSISVQWNKNFANFEAAEKELNSLFSEQDLPVPTAEKKSLYVQTKDGAGINMTATGFEYERAMSQYDSYTYGFYLEKDLACTRTGGTTVCEGQAYSKVKTYEYFQDKALDGVSLKGTIRYELYKIK